MSDVGYLSKIFTRKLILGKSSLNFNDGVITHKKNIASEDRQ